MDTMKTQGDSIRMAVEAISDKDDFLIARYCDNCSYVDNISHWCDECESVHKKEITRIINIIEMATVKVCKMQENAAGNYTAECGIIYFKEEYKLIRFCYGCGGQVVNITYRGSGIGS